jgi:hypothetical protein
MTRKKKPGKNAGLFPFGGSIIDETGPYSLLTNTNSSKAGCRNLPAT